MRLATLEDLDRACLTELFSPCSVETGNVLDIGGSPETSCLRQTYREPADRQISSRANSHFQDYLTSLESFYV